MFDVSLSKQEFKFERYRLKFIVDELKLTENPLDYKTALLAFVNCLIISTPQFKDRVQMRNEFIGKLFAEILLKFQNFLAEIRCYTIANCSRFEIIDCFG